jgi:hypothetical protein
MYADKNGNDNKKEKENNNKLSSLSLSVLCNEEIKRQNKGKRTPNIHNFSHQNTGKVFIVLVLLL